MSVFPDYYTKIKPDIERISLKIASVRDQKDIDNENAKYATFENYGKEVSILNDLYTDKILPMQKSLHEYNRKRFWMRFGTVLIYPTIIGLFVGLFNFLLKFYSGC